MKKQLILFFFLFIGLTIYSQKIKIAEGDFSSLKGVKNYNIVFDYSNLEIINYESEADFLKDKMLLREKMSEGAGREFKRLWFKNRDSLYAPYFIKYFIKYSGNKEKINLFEDNKECKYSIMVSSEKMYSGYNVGVWNEEPKLYTTMTIYETSNPDIVILKTKQIFTKGVTKYDSWNRITTCYGKLGKSLAIYLSRKT